MFKTISYNAKKINLNYKSFGINKSNLKFYREINIKFFKQLYVKKNSNKLNGVKIIH